MIVRALYRLILLLAMFVLPAGLLVEMIIEGAIEGSVEYWTELKRHYRLLFSAFRKGERV